MQFLDKNANVLGNADVLRATAFPPIFFPSPLSLFRNSVKCVKIHFKIFCLKKIKSLLELYIVLIIYSTNITMTYSYLQVCFTI